MKSSMRNGPETSDGRIYFCNTVSQLWVPTVTEQNRTLRAALGTA